MVRVKGGFAVAPRCAPKARTLDARQPVRPSFHQAHQGELSPSEGLTPLVVAGDWGDWEEAGRRKFPQKFDGEIKAPGPFRSMSLVVLRNFRDLVLSRGPGFQDFLSRNNDLSGTNGTRRRDWSRPSR